MIDCIECIHYPVCSNFQKYMFKTGAKYCGEYFNLDKHEEEIRADERAKTIEEIICILKHRNTTILENGYEYHGYDDDELDEIAEQLKEQK